MKLQSLGLASVNEREQSVRTAGALRDMIEVTHGVFVKRGSTKHKLLM